MSDRRPTALIADDEPLLREELARLLESAWPKLNVVAQARNGREAIDRFDALQPDVCFLDVQMPGTTGVEVAQHIGRRAHIVFVTAYDQYAVQAFAHGVLDYLVKPIELERLADTVERLQDRLRRVARPNADMESLLRELAAQVQRGGGAETLRWIRASVGQTLRLIPVDNVDFLRSDEKYTLIGWHDDAGEAREAVIRTPLKDLLPQLDRAQFAQVHRSVVVNLRAVSHLTRGANETAEIHLKSRPEVLPVSRTYLHLFRQM
jgi:DNA-binding LytR/AlgR family response regulator